MSKLISLAFATIFFLPCTNHGTERFAKYKAIEAYEVGPSILIMPSYSSDGQVCKIGLQKVNYSPEIIKSESDLSNEEINKIFEDLVPQNERGSRSKSFPETFIVQSGTSIITSDTYENVTLQIYEFELPGSKRGKTSVKTVAAVIRWNNRKCQ